MYKKLCNASRYCFAAAKKKQSTYIFKFKDFNRIHKIIFWGFFSEIDAQLLGKEI